jgi:16S rRNA (cytidine1402-2'-O)-methyltransferase
LEIESKKEGRSQILIETPYRNAAIWQSLIGNLSAETKLCYAMGIGSNEEDQIEPHQFLHQAHLPTYA